MFEHAFLEELGGGRLRPEEERLAKACAARAIPITLYTAKRMRRRQLPLTRRSFVAGDADMTNAALRQLEIEPPSPNDYPRSLEPFLRRRVWKTTLGWVEAGLLGGDAVPVFVKPAAQRKAFTGRVVEFESDLGAFGTASRRQEVWCSEVVAWLSEWRVYVASGAVLAVDHYAGSRDALDLVVVNEAVQAFEASGEAPAGYALDFGLLTSGQAALVEMNDGFSLGAYEIAAEPFATLHFARWAELVGNST